MASTFAELYSDFIDAVKIYTEKLDLTELQFMRMLTRGMQIFQKETEYVEAYAELTAGSSGFFIPDDLLRVIQIKDSNGYTLLSQNFRQYNRNLELWQDGYLETPTDYSMRMQGYLANQGGESTTADRDGTLRQSTSRIYSIYERSIKIHPDYDDTSLYIWYIPDLHAISINSSQWSEYDSTASPPYPTTPTKWYPIDTRFTTMFTTTGINIKIAQFEEAFLNYAIAKFLKSQGSANYKVFEESFNQAKEWALINKPTQFKEGVSDYMFSPYS